VLSELRPEGKRQLAVFYLDESDRKNSLFVANPRGGRTTAILASLASTCRRHDIDPQRYLTQLLHLPSLPTCQLHAWLPDQWKQRQSAPPLNC
jgi:transposase